MFGVGSVFGFMAVRSMRPRAQGFCLGLGVAYLAQKAVK